MHRETMKPGKGCGPDDVLSNDLKIVGAEVADGLTRLMTKITEKSEYPSQWKIRKVKSAPKKEINWREEITDPYLSSEYQAKSFKGL